MSSFLNLNLKARLRSKSLISSSRNETKSSQSFSDQQQQRRGSDSEGSRIASLGVTSSDSSTDSGMFSSPDASLSAPEAEENDLADEQDGLSETFSGRLTFSENLPSPLDSKDISYEVPCDGTAAVLSNITFEVISAEVIREGRSGHVTYTILINPHKDSMKISQTLIKRRYSDFENLHHSLKKKFSSIMSSISFPRKVLMGNFTSETIAKRSTAFEQYLTHLYSIFEVRYSRDFMEFFINGDLRTAVDFFLEKKYSNSVPLLEKLVPILEKLYGNFHILVCQCLCCLVVCYIQLDKVTIAHTCAEVAIKCCLPQSSAADDELRIAILTTTIRLCWKMGIDKKELETKLESMHADGVNVEKVRDLKEVLVKTFETSLPR